MITLESYVEVASRVQCVGGFEKNPLVLGETIRTKQRLMRRACFDASDDERK